MNHKKVIIFFINIVVLLLLCMGCTHYQQPKKTEAPYVENTPEINEEDIATEKPSKENGGEEVMENNSIYTYENFVNNVVGCSIACKADGKTIVSTASTISRPSEEGRVYLEDLQQVIAIDEKGDKSIIGDFHAQYINSDGEYLYYNSGDEWGGSIHKFNLSTKEDEIIFDGTAEQMILQDDYLYFIEASDRGVSTIVKMKKDGSKKEVLLSDSDFKNIIIENDQIFYSLYEGSIGVLNINGSNNEILYKCVLTPDDLNYDNNYIYWREYNHPEYKIMRMPIDGTDVETIISSEEKVFLSIVRNNIVYYFQWDEYLFTIISQKNLNDGTLKQHMIRPYIEGDKISLLDDWMYIYSTYPDSISVDATCRYNIKTDVIEYLTENN